MNAEKRRMLFVQTLIVGGAIGCAVAIFMTSKARAHDAPTGWSYPTACCSGFDCREVADADIVEGARGYEIRATGEMIPMTSPKIKQSPDGRFHWCSEQGAEHGKTICLFIPPRGF